MKKSLVILGCTAIAAVIVVIVVYKWKIKDVPMVDSEAEAQSVLLESISGSKFASKWLDMRSNGARLIDVRTLTEYNAGHYQSAELIDFYANNFKEQLNKLDKEKQYFIYCRTGGRSGQTLQTMRELGFTKVYNLSGGYAGNGGVLPIVEE